MSNKQTEDTYTNLFDEFRVEVEKIENEMLDRIIQINSSADGCLDDFHRAAGGYCQMVFDYPHPNGGYYKPTPGGAFVATLLEQAITKNKHLSIQKYKKPEPQVHNGPDLVDDCFDDDVPFDL